MNDMTEQRHERIPLWLQWLVAFAMAQSVGVFALLIYFLATR